MIARNTTQTEVAALAIAGAIATLEQFHSPNVANAAIERLSTAFLNDPIADRVWELLGFTEPRIPVGKLAERIAITQR